LTSEARSGTNQPQAVSNSSSKHTAWPRRGRRGPGEKKNCARDDGRRCRAGDVKEWMQATPPPARTHTGRRLALNKRIIRRFERVRTDSGDFPSDPSRQRQGYLAYGSFLATSATRKAQKTQYENSGQLDPKKSRRLEPGSRLLRRIQPVTTLCLSTTEGHPA